MPAWKVSNNDGKLQKNVNKIKITQGCSFRLLPVFKRQFTKSSLLLFPAFGLYRDTVASSRASLESSASLSWEEHGTMEGRQDGFPSQSPTHPWLQSQHLHPHYVTSGHLLSSLNFLTCKTGVITPALVLVWGLNEIMPRGTSQRVQLLLELLGSLRLL